MQYRSDLPSLPKRMQTLPLDARGYPVPWFVAWLDDKPDFRVVRPGGFSDAYNHRTCWLCGGKIEGKAAFVVGPMCGVNKISAEPPSHVECADYAARACPFMTRPLAVRNDRELPADAREPGGIMLRRNPGVCLVWITREWKAMRAGDGAVVQMGKPVEVRFYREGRRATRAEIMHSVETGLPTLRKIACAEGPLAMAELTTGLDAFKRLLPAAA